MAVSYGRPSLPATPPEPPPGFTRKETEGEDAGSDAEQEEKNAATLFYETLIDKAEIGEVAGDTFATFLEILHLTPR